MVEGGRAESQAKERWKIYGAAIGSWGFLKYLDGRMCKYLDGHDVVVVVDLLTKKVLVRVTLFLCSMLSTVCIVSYCNEISYSRNLIIDINTSEVCRLSLLSCFARL